MSNFFEYIIDINKNREKEGKKKIYTIFIFNQGNESSEPSLIEFLSDNNLFKDLIEKIDESKEKKAKINFKDKYKNKNSIKNNQKFKYNIVSLNLIGDKESKRGAHGIDTLLQLTLYFIRKDNPLSENYFKELKIHQNTLKNHILDDTKRKTIEDNVINIYKKFIRRKFIFQQY